MIEVQMRRKLDDMRRAMDDMLTNHEAELRESKLKQWVCDWLLLLI